MAGQNHRPGNALLLDYGERPLQDMLYHYGFVPAAGPDQVYAASERVEGFGSCWETLVIKSASLVSIV